MLFQLLSLTFSRPPVLIFPASPTTLFPRPPPLQKPIPPLRNHMTINLITIPIQIILGNQLTPLLRTIKMPIHPIHPRNITFLMLLINLLLQIPDLLLTYTAPIRFLAVVFVPVTGVIGLR